MGQRKVAGASRNQLVLQFLGESVLTAVLAYGLAMLIARTALPYLNAALGIQMTFAAAMGREFLLAAAGLGLFVILASGGVPALTLSRIPVARVLKGRQRHGTAHASLRKSLVVLQFSTCGVLVLVVVIAYSQMEFIRSTRLNVRGDEVVVIDNATRAIGGNYEAFRSALIQSPDVLDVALGLPPGQRMAGTLAQLDSTDTGQYVEFAYVDEHYVETLGLEIKEGEALGEPGQQPDSSIINNETLAALVGREDVVGSRLDEVTPGTVVGIVEDFHVLPLHEPIGPMVLQHASADKSNIIVRHRSGAVADGLAHIDIMWRRFVSDELLEYRFLDDRLDDAYRRSFVSASCSGYSH